MSSASDRNRGNLERTCSNCCAFGVIDSTVGVECTNLTTFRPISGGEWRLARSTDCCPSHKTREEDAREDVAVMKFFSSLSLEPLSR